MTSGVQKMKVCGECIHWYGHAYLLKAISIGLVACDPIFGV